MAEWRNWKNHYIFTCVFMILFEIMLYNRIILCYVTVTLIKSIRNVNLKMKLVSLESWFS